MTLSISSLQAATTNSRFLSKGFRNVIENHIEYLQEIATSTVVSVELNSMIKYQGDFYGYLNSINVNQDIHWIVMRVNEMHNPIEFGEKFPQVLIPDRKELDYLLGRYLNVDTSI